MATPADPLEPLLREGTRATLAAALRASRIELGTTGVARLSARLRSFDEPRRPLRIAVLRGYSTELLRPHFELEALLHGFEAKIVELPHGMLSAEGSERERLAELRPDVAFLFLLRADLAPGLASPSSLVPAAERRGRVEAAAARLDALVADARELAPMAVVASVLPRFGEPELGAYDAIAEDSEAALGFELDRALGAVLRERGGMLCDLGLWLAEVGRRGFDARLWSSSRFPFSAAGAAALVRRLFACALPLLAAPLKCIVLDADDTLWGGILGEDGRDGIRLGADYPGSCHVAFQRRLLELRRRGLLLALASRNDPEPVLDVLRHHPQQQLREADFAALEIGWGTKVEALRRIATKLGIGTEALLFVDDSAHECLAVRTELPEVEVVQTPANALELPGCLDRVARLEIARLTDEDRRRPAMMAAEDSRRALAATAGSRDDYLRSLGMILTVHVDERAAIPRLAQLAQKTNQFNLTTRRHDERAIGAFMDAVDSLVLSFSLADALGDSGIVGLAVVRGGEIAEVESFLMSCRVIGRGAETAFLSALVDYCRERGTRRLRAHYLATARNGLVRDFWFRHGFADAGDGSWTLELAEARIAPGPIVIRRQPSGSVK